MRLPEHEMLQISASRSEQLGKTSSMISDKNRAINDFGVRSFRDMADQDYIAARLAHKHELLPQFLWMAQQALEKYLKAILLFYRIPAPKVYHDLLRAKRLLEKLPFEVELSDTTVEMIEIANAFGPNRYLGGPWWLHGYVLPKFDRAVWEIRRYCQSIDPEGVDPSGCFPAVSESLQISDVEHPTIFSIPGGLLEKILSDKKHPARKALIWQNACFGPRRRKTIRAKHHLCATNPPLMLSPEILDDMLKLVHIPNDLEAVCRNHWKPEKEKDNLKE